MKNNEIDLNMISDNINKLSEQFIKLREVSWLKLPNSTTEDQSENFDLLKKNYQRELKLLLEKHFSDLFSTEEGCLIAKFIKLFGVGNLEDDVFISIRQGLAQNEEAYPIFLKIDNVTKVFRKHLCRFFVSSEENYNQQSESFSLEKTENQLANIIIATEIKRAITDFSTRPQAQGHNNNFSITLNELDDQFEVTLNK